MKVTGWTNWEDDNYLDTAEEWRKIYSRGLKKLHKEANYDAFCDKCRNKELSEEEQNKYFDSYNKKYDVMLTECKSEFSKLNLPQDDELEQCVIEEIKNKGYKFTGDYHQYANNGAPIIDDKYIYRVSQRSWGDIIAQAYPNEIDDGDGFGYLDWAWMVPEGEEQIVPKEEDYEETSND